MVSTTENGIEVTVREVAVRGFESLDVRRPSAYFELFVARGYRHASRTSTRWFTEELLASCTCPQLSRAQVRALDELARRRLILAIVEAADAQATWRALYGSPLSTNERLYAVMKWRFDKQVHALGVRCGTALDRADVARARTGGRSVLDNYMRTQRQVERVMLSVTKPMRQLDAMLGARTNYLPQFGVGNRLGETLRRQTSMGDAVTRLQTPMLGIAASESLAARLSAAVDPDRRLRRDPFAAFRGAGFAQQMGQVGGIRSISESFTPLHMSVKARQQRSLLASLLGTTGRPTWVEALSKSANAFGLGLNRQVAGFSGALRASMGITNVDSLQLSMDRWLAPLREASVGWAAAGRFLEQWESDALWVLVQNLSLSDYRVLADLDRGDVERAIFDALERVVLDGELTAAMADVVDRAPMLSDVQREWLGDGLRLAGEGKWVKALPPLMLGLEGALRSLAVHRQLMTPNQRYANAKSKRVKGAIKVMELLDLGEDFVRFAKRRLFDGTGNEFRHGWDGADLRVHVLLAIVGLVGWMDEGLELRVLPKLGQMISGNLRDCIDATSIRRLSA